MSRSYVSPSAGHILTEESMTEMRVHLDISDSDPEAILLDVNEDSIQFAAETDEAIPVADGIMHALNSFYRKIPLPGGLDVDRIEVSAEHGHIDLLIPKKLQIATNNP